MCFIFLFVLHGDMGYIIKAQLIKKNVSEFSIDLIKDVCAKYFKWLFPWHVAKSALSPYSSIYFGTINSGKIIIIA